MGSHERHGVLETGPATTSSPMQLSREQLGQTTFSVPRVASNMSLQSPSPCVLPPSKVAIPRLPIHNEAAARPRAKKACKECRDQKTKCDGYQPCGRCVGLGIDCLYVDGKKDTRERRLQDLESQVQAYEKLLRRLQFRAAPEDEELIAQTLAQYRLLPESNETATDYDRSQTATEDSCFGIECVQEDFHGNKGLQPIGFIGGPSEVSWVRDLNRAVGKDTAILDAATPNQAPNDDSQVLSKILQRDCSVYISTLCILLSPSLAEYPSRSSWRAITPILICDRQRSGWQF